MNKRKYSMAQLAANLEKAIHCDVGIYGLNILLYGWRRRYTALTNAALSERKRKHGFQFLYEDEVKIFSKYVGYDLTK
jgi:hypothetical protein